MNPTHAILKQAIDTACLLENQKAVNRKKECYWVPLKNYKWTLTRSKKSTIKEIKQREM